TGAWALSQLSIPWPSDSVSQANSAWAHWAAALPVDISKDALTAMLTFEVRISSLLGNWVLGTCSLAMSLGRSAAGSGGSPTACALPTSLTIWSGNISKTLANILGFARRTDLAKAWEAHCCHSGLCGSCRYAMTAARETAERPSS